MQMSRRSGNEAASVPGPERAQILTEWEKNKAEAATDTATEKEAVTGSEAATETKAVTGSEAVTETATATDAVTETKAEAGTEGSVRAAC